MKKMNKVLGENNGLISQGGKTVILSFYKEQVLEVY